MFYLKYSEYSSVNSFHIILILVFSYISFLHFIPENSSLSTDKSSDKFIVFFIIF